MIAEYGNNLTKVVGHYGAKSLEALSDGSDGGSQISVLKGHAGTTEAGASITDWDLDISIAHQCVNHLVSDTSLIRTNKCVPGQR